MGGHAAGDVASQIAVEMLAERYFAEPGNPREALESAVRQANLGVWQGAHADPARKGMGTTLVCAAIVDGQALIANVGDSQAYVSDGDNLRLVTRDHTWVAEQMVQGTISAEEAERHPFRHVLTRALGSLERVEIDLFEETLEPGTALLLCSDGLSKYVPAAEVLRVIQARPAQEAAEQLVSLANELGGTDNVSVVVVRRR
jgi:protein phosphatase